jgi:hypothetical protein
MSAGMPMQLPWTETDKKDTRNESRIGTSTIGTKKTKDLINNHRVTKKQNRNQTRDR